VHIVIEWTFIVNILPPAKKGEYSDIGESKICKMIVSKSQHYPCMPLGHG